MLIMRVGEQGIEANGGKISCDGLPKASCNDASFLPSRRDAYKYMYCNGQLRNDGKGILVYQPQCWAGLACNYSELLVRGRLLVS